MSKAKKSRAATHKLSRAPTRRVHCIENIVDGNKYVEQSQPTDKDEIIAKIQLHNSEWRERDGKKCPRSETLRIICEVSKNYARRVVSKCRSRAKQRLLLYFGDVVCGTNEMNGAAKIPDDQCSSCRREWNGIREMKKRVNGIKMR